MNGNNDITYDPVVAEEIGACYIFVATGKRPANAHRISAQIRKFLPEAAMNCANGNVDPLVYVQAQKRYESNFYPNVLANPRALENVERYKAFISMQMDPAKLYDVQLGYLTDALTRTSRSVEGILMDRGLQFYPWFRILITKKPNPKIIAEFGEEARLNMNWSLEQFLKTLTYEDGTPFDLARIPKK